MEEDLVLDLKLLWKLNKIVSQILLILITLPKKRHMSKKYTYVYMYVYMYVCIYLNFLAQTTEQTARARACSPLSLKETES